MTQCVGSPWGAIATDILDGPGCVLGCRDSFRRSFVPENETFDRVCERLTQIETAERDAALLGLYCCDSQVCGVDNISQPGIDPNVDWVINFCQSKGFAVISDPGPPAATHVCTNPILSGDAASCQQTTTYDTRATTLPTQVPTSTTLRVSNTLTTALSTTSSPMVPSSTTPGDGTPPPRISSIEDPSLIANLAGSLDDQGNPGLSTASKVIIAVTIPLAIIVVVIAALWRRRGRRPNPSQTPGSDTSPPTLNLVSPLDENWSSSLTSPSASYRNADGEPLTPPPRLQERRFLVSQSPQPLSPNKPSSRLYPGFHVPRAAPTSASGELGIILPQTTYNPSYSQPSTGGAAATYSTTNQPRSASSPATPVSAQFSPRVNYSATMSGMPGPPPDRALPSTPPRARTKSRRTKGINESIRADAIGVALDFPPQNTAKHPVSPISSRRQSWGTWSISEEGPSQMPQPSPSRSKAERSPVMNERDLERLAGTY